MQSEINEVTVPSLVRMIQRQRSRNWVARTP